MLRMRISEACYRRLCRRIIQAVTKRPCSRPCHHESTTLLQATGHQACSAASSGGCDPCGIRQMGAGTSAWLIARGNESNSKSSIKGARNSIPFYIDKSTMKEDAKARGNDPGERKGVQGGISMTPLKWFCRFLKKYRALMLVGIVLTTAIAALSIVNPW